MPSATARRLCEDQIPSFMSVFGVDSISLDQPEIVAVDESSLMAMGTAKLLQPQLRPGDLPPDTLHKHHDSTSTQNTESAESSPTTTASCTDSSDLSDPSPSSSPDSPVNLAPLSSFAPASLAGMAAGLSILPVSPATNIERPMTSPAPRRAKNMKGLSIQSPYNPLSSAIASEPPSPASSFIKPLIPAMKRKPSQLSLKTSSSDLIARSTIEAATSPSLPPILQRRALKHSTSSPHMLSNLMSPTYGPSGGMTIPTVLERNESGLSEFLRPSRPTPPGGFELAIKEEDSPIRTQIASRAVFEFEPYHEAENNEDQKTPGYPDGPVAIYGDNVFLYLEPTAEEASRFDVVINVAREVHNPFSTSARSQAQPKPALDRSDPESPIPDTALTTASFATAFEFLVGENARTATPAIPAAAAPARPEYIHMPWDHNTDISQDLMTLCELIREKTKEGKKVLVHCQQGASRSASLIIAYGIYQNPELSVNDAYYAAQAKSRWISPNMKLMYCLQDFKKEMAKRKLPTLGLNLRSGRSPTKHRLTLSADNIDIAPKEPLSAPLPNEDVSPTSAHQSSPSRGRGNSTPNPEVPISPGPSSAPSSFNWTEKEDTYDAARPTQSDLLTAARPSHLKPDAAFGLAPMARPPPLRGLLQEPESFAQPLLSPGLPPALGLCQTPPSPRLSSDVADMIGFSSGSSSSRGFGPASISVTSKRPPPPAAGGTGGSTEGPGDSGATAPASRPRHVAAIGAFLGQQLTSPRFETMTSNPLHPAPVAPVDPGATIAGMRFIEAPPTPGDTMFPRDPFYPFGRPIDSADPRSPATRGETPIVRSIDEMI